MIRIACHWTQNLHATFRVMRSYFHLSSGFSLYSIVRVNELLFGRPVEMHENSQHFDEQHKPIMEFRGI